MKRLGVVQHCGQHCRTNSRLLWSHSYRLQRRHTRTITHPLLCPRHPYFRRTECSRLQRDCEWGHCRRGLLQNDALVGARYQSHLRFSVLASQSPPSIQRVVPLPWTGDVNGGARRLVFVGFCFHSGGQGEGLHKRREVHVHRCSTAITAVAATVNTVSPQWVRRWGTLPDGIFAVI